LVRDLTPLHTLTQLRSLDLSATTVSSAQVAALQQALPEIEIQGGTA
jgi:hypothetical protein